MAYGNALIDLFSHHVAAAQLIAPSKGQGNITIRSTAPMTVNSFAMMREEFRATGRTIIALIFDIKNAPPRLDQVWLMMPSTDPAVLARGDDLTLLVDCRLWAPVGDGSIVIVAPRQFGGHFVVNAARDIEHRPGLPARDLTAGMQRAAARIARLARSADLHPREDTTLLIGR